MPRLIALIAALAGAVLLAVLASRPPAPLPADAPAEAFSAGRAMADIREIGHAPHPTGSPEHARVRAYLLDRLRALGLETREAPVPLSLDGQARLARWGGTPAAGVNLIGVLPGRDRTAPAVVLMAHYDTVWGSPGAADDSAGVAALLEVVRILKLSGPPARDVAVIFTDAEELNLDGARAFFDADPLGSRIGALVNLEARGSGGRAVMFETGPDNGAMAAIFARAVRRPSAHSLSVYVYRLMPNATDFTLAKRREIPGFNFAFLGRSSLYHSPQATPDALEPGTVQHMGGQVLDLARALANAPALPAKAPDAVFSDILGLKLILYPAWAGWLVLAAAAGLFGFASFRARQAGRLAWTEVGWGALAALSVTLHAALGLQVFNHLSGSGPDAGYYDRLAALPRLEAQAVLIGAAALVFALNARRRSKGLWAAAPAGLLMLAPLAVGGGSPAMAAVGAAAAITALAAARRPLSPWGGWTGSAALVLLLAFVAQALEPTTTPILVWPLLVAAVAAAGAAAVDPSLRRPAVLGLLAGAAALAGGWLLSVAHLAFLGVGADLPEAMAAFVLLFALGVQPLMRGVMIPRLAAALAAVLLLAAAGLALSVRWDAPAATVPVYAG